MYPVANLQTCDGTLKGTLCVVQFHLLPSSPGHTPGDLTFFFSYSAAYSPSPGREKETIPRPRDSYLPQPCLYVYEKGCKYWLLNNSVNGLFCQERNDFNTLKLQFVLNKLTFKYELLFGKILLP